VEENEGMGQLFNVEGKFEKRERQAFLTNFVYHYHTKVWYEHFVKLGTVEWVMGVGGGGDKF
jgi:hypothetical protein